MKKIFFAVFLCFIGCSSDNFPSYNKLETLRILSLIATPPETVPGAAFTITPVLSDYNGQSRQLLYSAEGCADPQTYTIYTCDGRADRVAYATDAQIQGLNGPNFTGAVTAISVGSMTIPTDIFTGKNIVQQLIGVPFLFFIKIYPVDKSVTVTAVKRIMVSIKPTPNANPTLTDIMGDGGSLTTLPRQGIRLRAAYTSGSEESYSVPQGDGSVKVQKEELLTSWFSTDGTFKTVRTVGGEETYFEPPKIIPAGKALVVVAIIRDGRGGEAVLTKYLQ